jgi:hypothetical protein
MFELGHTQIRDGDQVGDGSKTSGRALCLLQQSIHCLHVGIAAVVQHAAHHLVDALFEGVGQLL